MKTLLKSYRFARVYHGYKGSFRNYIRFMYARYLKACPSPLSFTLWLQD